MRTARPIFIIGAPRSGTSITNWALGQHPNIQPMEESVWIASMGVGAYLSYLNGSDRGRYSHLSNAAFGLAPFMQRIGSAIDAIVDDVFAARRRRLQGTWASDPAQNPMQIQRGPTDPKQRWIDGTPLNTFFVWILAEMFPEAQFIHNLRCPDEVATSLEAFDRVGGEAMALEQGLQSWIAHTESAWYAECGLGSDRAFRLDFERIAREPEDLLREVCAFLGEDFSPDCLLPLATKLNSSQVDDRRAQNLSALVEHPEYQRAQAIHKLVSEQPASTQPDPIAWEVVHQRFLDHCHDRKII